MSLKIMVVDKEAVSLQLMRTLAAPLGHTVITYDDSDAARERAEQQRFDVAFVGLGVPDLDGYEVVQRIRASEPNRETTIVMLSALDDIQSLRKAFGVGADYVLTKPVGASRLNPMLAAMDSPGWKEKTRAARLPLFTEVVCTWGEKRATLRTMNISESGMLLQGTIDAEVGEDVSLDFKIGEIRAALSLEARLVRKEGSERVGVGFKHLAVEDRNAIHVYVLGRLKQLTPSRDFSDVGLRRMMRDYY